MSRYKNYRSDNAQWVSKVGALTQRTHIGPILLLVHIRGHALMNKHQQLHLGPARCTSVTHMHHASTHAPTCTYLSTSAATPSCASSCSDVSCSSLSRVVRAMACVAQEGQGARW